MKTKHFLMMLVAVGGLCHGMAQGRFDAAVSAGMNLCQIDGDDDGSYSHLGARIGVGTSFALGRDLGSPWRMVVELAFTQKGSTIDEYDRKLSANYVEIPILMSYNALDNRLRIAAGVAPALLVGSTVTNNGIDDQASADNFKALDALPLTVSARYRFADHLAVEVRYQNSMVSITKQNSSGTYRLWRDNKGAFNRLLTFGLNYQF